MCGGCLFRLAMYAITGCTVFVAATILGVGSSLASELHDYVQDIFELVGDNIESDQYQSAVYIMISVGCLLFLAALFGCWGTWRKKTTWLMIFNIITIVIVALIITCGILAATYRNSLDSEQLESDFEDQVYFDYGGSGNEDTITKYWDVMQYQTKCCGGAGFADYQDSTFFNDTAYAVPQSCCVEYDGSTLEDHPYEECRNATQSSPPDYSLVHETGCAERFEEDVDNDADIVMGVCFGLGIFNLIAIFVACCIKGRFEDENATV